MVWSNKKLKEKLREALGEEALANSRQNKDANSSLAYLEELRSAKKGLSKREKRRQKKELLNEEVIQGAQNNKDQASQANDGNTKKEKKKKKKGTVMENKDTHLENKDTHLEDGGNEGIKTNKKKKKRKIGEDKELEQNGKPDENRGNQLMTNGDHSENGNVEESKINKKEKKKKKKQKDNRKSEQVTKDELALSVGVEPSEDIIINVHEVTVNESQQSEYDPLKVYVGGIPYYSNEDDIRSFFEGCGTVTEVDCMTFPDSGKFCGIALISFKTEPAAKRALALDGSDMGGRFLKVQQYKTVKSSKHDKRAGFEPTKADNSNRAYIGNLFWDITEDDLKLLFKDCEISSIRFGTDKTTGEFLGYGHVDFADDVSLAMALKLDQEVVCGRPIRISYAVPKKVDSSNKAYIGNSKLVGDINSTSKKKKRRTCYSCGEPGHLSDSCPQIQSTEIVDTDRGS